jgi:hypothetical protein
LWFQQMAVPRPQRNGIRVGISRPTKQTPDDDRADRRRPEAPVGPHPRGCEHRHVTDRDQGGGPPLAGRQGGGQEHHPRRDTSATVRQPPTAVNSDKDFSVST